MNRKKCLFVSILLICSIMMVALMPSNIGTVYASNNGAIDWSRCKSVYYRSQLSGNQLKLYDDLNSRCTRLLECKDNIKGNIGKVYTNLSDDEMLRVMFAFACSNPQFFFLSDGYSWGIEPGKGTFCTIETYREFDDSTKRLQALKRLEISISSILSKIDATGGNTYSDKQLKREQLIYNYIIDNVEYDKNAAMSQSCYSALVNKKSVCAGYSEAFELLCQYAEIPCICVTSDVHEWNQVQIGENWYMVDSTWADTSESKNDYFNRSNANMTYGHDIESAWDGFNIPACYYDYNDKLLDAGIYMCQQNRGGILCGMVVETSNQTDLMYRWIAYSYKTGEWYVVSDWKLNNEWLTWNPGEYGDYLIQGEVYSVENPSKIMTDVRGINHHPNIKGICQMPYSEGGYLIGIESYENPNQQYSYELLIYDCTLETWVYTTGRMYVSSGNAAWTVWQPIYGYYWTLFRVYDANGNIIDQSCYGFANI